MSRNGVYLYANSLMIIPQRTKCRQSFKEIVPLLRARNGLAPEFDADEDHPKLTMSRRSGPRHVR